MYIFHEIPGYTFAQFIAEKFQESTVYIVAAVPADGIHYGTVADVLVDRVSYNDLAHMVIRKLFKVQADGSKIGDSRPLAKIYLNNAVLIIDSEIFDVLKPLAQEYEARHDSKVLLIRPLPPMINKVT
jgi:hypothetical protein